MNLIFCISLIVLLFEEFHCAPLVVYDEDGTNYIETSDTDSWGYSLGGHLNLGVEAGLKDGLLSVGTKNDIGTTLGGHRTKSTRRPRPPVTPNGFDHQYDPQYNPWSLYSQPKWQYQPIRPQYPQSAWPYYGQPAAPQYPQPAWTYYGQQAVPAYPQPAWPYYGQPDAPQYPQPAMPQYPQPAGTQYGGQPVGPQYNQPGEQQYGQLPSRSKNNTPSGPQPRQSSGPQNSPATEEFVQNSGGPPASGGSQGLKPLPESHLR